MKAKHKKIEVGDVFETNEGGSVTVVEYISASKVMVEHDDIRKYVAIVEAGQLRKGQVKNPYRPSVFGVGCVGVGRYRPSISRKKTPAYQAWRDMLRRCYSAEQQSKFPTYVGCSVHDDWHNFQNFAEWFYSGTNSQNAGFDLDKDLLVFGNKVYSPEACSFVPQQINRLLNCHGAARGDSSQGVRLNGNGFTARLWVGGERTTIGTYSTLEQAHSAYKKAKEENVKSMAAKWRDWLHPVVYENLMSYSV